MWLALLAMAATFGIGLALDLTVPTRQAPYLALLVLVLLDGGVRALGQNARGRDADRGFAGGLFGSALVVLGLAWIGEQLSLGRIGSVSSFTLAIEVVLAARILGSCEALREVLATPPATAVEPGATTTDQDGKAGRLA